MPGFALHHDRRRLDDARLSEHLTQPLGGRRKSQTADEELLSHVTPLRDLPPSRTVPGTRKTVPEAWSGEGGNPQSKPAPRPDASSVARLCRGWGPIIVNAIRPPVTLPPGTYVLSFASSSAHAVATPVFGVLPPRGVAHPPASMNSRCFHDSTFWNSVSFAEALGCSMNRATQDVVRAVITAELARSAAIRSAVLPRVQPNHEKPMIIIPTTPTIAPQAAGLNHGTCSCMRHLR